MKPAFSAFPLLLSGILVTILQRCDSEPQPTRDSAANVWRRGKLVIMSCMPQPFIVSDIS